jgi:hypothetical protein
MFQNGLLRESQASVRLLEIAARAGINAGDHVTSNILPTYLALGAPKLRSMNTLLRCLPPSLWECPHLGLYKEMQLDLHTSCSLMDRLPRTCAPATYLSTPSAPAGLRLLDRLNFTAARELEYYRKLR